MVNPALTEYHNSSALERTSRLTDKMKILSALAMGSLLMLASAPVLKADVCDEISTLGTRWHKLSEYIEKHSDDGKLRKVEVKKVVADLQEIVPPTKVLGNRLIENFKGQDNQRVRAWGKQ